MRTRIIASAKPVHHHDTSRVGLSCILVLGGGALEYWSRGRIISEVNDAHQPPERGERIEKPTATQAEYMIYYLRTCSWRRKTRKKLGPCMPDLSPIAEV